ncbi:MAG: hypothetical protein ACR2FH_04715, partial [Caulobacteraceae bacterium]
VQHHHAHVAACMAENGIARDSPPILGIALDGLGYGEGGELWGGEFLLADYGGFERLASFRPVAMIGGDAASREPWRNLYAHLMAAMGWAAFTREFGALEVHAFLAAKPRALLDAATASGLNTPLASSCGRLFDAVAAALGLCRERQAFEGQAACVLEAAVDRGVLRHEDEALAYPLALEFPAGSGLPYLEPLPMWRALLADLARGTPRPVMAARFHKGLAVALAATAEGLAERRAQGGARFGAVALSGGCFQNCILLEETIARLEARDFTVLSHAEVPANDGGLALGQGAIGAARILAGDVLDGNNRPLRG